VKRERVEGEGRGGRGERGGEKRMRGEGWGWMHISKQASKLESK